MSDLITICIVEDQEDVRTGLAAIISMTSGLHVLGTFSNAEQAIQEIPRHAAGYCRNGYKLTGNKWN